MAIVPVSARLGRDVVTAYIAHTFDFGVSRPKEPLSRAAAVRGSRRRPPGELRAPHPGPILFPVPERSLRMEHEGALGRGNQPVAAPSKPPGDTQRG